VFADRDGDIVECGDLAVPGAEDLADAADVDRIPARFVRQRIRPAVMACSCGRPWFPIECHHMAPGLATRVLNHGSTRRRRAGIMPGKSAFPRRPSSPLSPRAGLLGRPTR